MNIHNTETMSDIYGQATSKGERILKGKTLPFTKGA